MNAVEITNVSKRFRIQREKNVNLKYAFIGVLKGKRPAYEEFWALRNITFAAKQGKTVGIIGANGSGKSTLLRLIAGILRADEGSIQAFGRVAALIELGAGFNPELTGRENVYLNSSILGLRRKEVDAKIAEIVAFAELERFIDSPVKSYSSGMYMRLGFSVAVHVAPDILLIDEILAVGDEVFQKKCYRKIQEFQDRGKSILLVSHDLGAVEEVCDEAVLLVQGSVRAIGEPKDVIAEYHGLIDDREKMGEDPASEEAALSGGLVVSRYDIPTQMQAAHVYSAGITVANHGIGEEVVDSVDRLYFSYHWYTLDHEIYDFDGIRTQIPSDIAEAGRIVTFEAQIKAPSTPGGYILALDPVVEGSFWLSEQGYGGEEFQVEVTDSPGDVLGKLVEIERDPDIALAKSEDQPKIARIKDVRLLDSDGRERGVFRSSEPMCIEVTYTSETTLSRPIVGVALFDQDNRFCFGTNTYIGDCEIERKVGDVTVVLRVRELPFLEGHFALTVGIAEWEPVRRYRHLDYHDRRYRFAVEQPGEEEGLVRLEYEWEEM